MHYDETEQRICKLLVRNAGGYQVLESSRISLLILVSFFNGTCRTILLRCTHELVYMTFCVRTLAKAFDGWISRKRCAHGCESSVVRVAGPEVFHVQHVMLHAAIAKQSTGCDCRRDRGYQVKSFSQCVRPHGHGVQRTPKGTCPRPQSVVWLSAS